VKCVPGSWRTKTWKRFTDEITQGYGSDDLATRRKFIEKEIEVRRDAAQAGVPFLAGTDTPAGVHIFPGFSLHEELQRFVAGRIHSSRSAANRHVESCPVFSAWKISLVRLKKESSRILCFFPPIARGHCQYAKRSRVLL